MHLWLSMNDVLSLQHTCLWASGLNLDELGQAGLLFRYRQGFEGFFMKTISLEMMTLERYVDPSPHWGDPARQSVASLAHALSPVLEEHESRQGDGWDLSTANKIMANVRLSMKASWREKELMPGLVAVRIACRNQLLLMIIDHYFGLFCFFKTNSWRTKTQYLW